MIQSDRNVWWRCSIWRPESFWVMLAGPLQDPPRHLIQEVLPELHAGSVEQTARQRTIRLPFIFPAPPGQLPA